MLLKFRRWLVDVIGPETAPSVRGRPGQSLDASSYPSGVLRPELREFGNFFALSPWVNMGVSRMAEAAGVARLRVHDRSDDSIENTGHPILDLVGPYGMPNDSQDSLEFLEEHLTSDYLFGNVYWYWWDPSGGRGAPRQVYQLSPEAVKVVPGRGRNVDGYIYTHMGHEYALDVREITHFKRPNPYNAYYGLSAFVALYVDITGDRAMAYWNRDFFGEGVSLPAGILVVPFDTGEAEMRRLEYELSAKYGERRQTALVRAAPGAAAWFDGGLKHHDYDFLQGRELVRSMVFDAIGLPRGLLSESSTEAHARVAERQYYGNLYQRLMRITARLNADALGFWPGSASWATKYLDLRMMFADWQQESFRAQTLKSITSVNERRAIYNYPAMDGQDGLASVDAGGFQEEQNSFSVNGSNRHAESGNGSSGGGYSRTVQPA